MNIKEKKKEEKVIIYCRVSTSARKNNLETQKDRLINFANARGYKVHKVYTEIGSGFNDNRKRLQKILDDQDFTILLVEHKDRLTRIGFNYLETLLNKLGKKIEVLNSVDTDEKDIIQDFISIITSYTARIYGKRRTKRKTEELIKELKRKSKEDEI
jgi:predicted site-specific integrase-resolvase